MGSAKGQRTLGGAGKSCTTFPSREAKLSRVSFSGFTRPDDFLLHLGQLTGGGASLADFLPDAARLRAVAGGFTQQGDAGENAAPLPCPPSPPGKKRQWTIPHPEA